MREDTKRNKLAALLGLDVPTARTDHRPAVLRDNASREAEAVINFVKAPQTYARVTCRSCGQEFLVNRANVALCSDRCRANELAEMGIDWDWNRSPESRWYVSSQNGRLTNEPLVVPPLALKALETAYLLWGKKDTNVSSLDVGDAHSVLDLGDNQVVEI